MYRLETDEQAQHQIEALPGPHHEGMVTYLILDDQRRVDVLNVQWVG